MQRGKKDAATVAAKAEKNLGGGCQGKKRHSMQTGHHAGRHKRGKTRRERTSEEHQTSKQHSKNLGNRKVLLSGDEAHPKVSLRGKENLYLMHKPQCGQ